MGGLKVAAVSQTEHVLDICGTRSFFFNTNTYAAVAACGSASAYNIRTTPQHCVRVCPAYFLIPNSLPTRRAALSRVSGACSH